jgi:hypothetical protein
MKMYGGVEIQVHEFLTSALVVDALHASRIKPRVSFGYEGGWAPELIWTL